MPGPIWRASPALLNVAKNILVDATGARVVLAGAADYLMPFYTAGNGGPDSALAQSVPVNFDRRDRTSRR